MCNDTLCNDTLRGTSQEAGKGLCPRDMLSWECPLPSRPPCCHLGGASCNEGFPRAGPRTGI